MKVLYLLDSLNRGGAEILMLDLCRNAKENGLDIALAAFGGGDLEGDFCASGVKIFRLRRRIPVDPVLVYRLRKIIDLHRIDIVHANQPVEGIHAYLAALGRKTKLVLSHHGFIPDEKNRRTAKFLLPRVAKNIYVSKALRAWYESQAHLDTGINHTVVHNGVDEKRLAYSGESLKHEMGLSQEAFLFGMIANFYAAPRKDQKTVCEAFLKNSSQLPNSHFIFVGGVEKGAEDKYAECVAICSRPELKGRVHFLGRRSDMPKILDSLDVFVLSSLHEGLSIAVIEAMLKKKPCVLSDIEPFLEASLNGKLASIFRTGSPEDLAAKLIEIAENADFRIRLTQRAFDHAVHNFSIEAYINRLRDLYKGLLEH